MSESKVDYIVNLIDRAAQDRAWNDYGFKLADQIDREMCEPESIATLQRAADLVTLLDYGERGAVEIRVVRGEVRVCVVDLCDPEHTRVYESDGAQAIAAGAAWARQTQAPQDKRGLFVAPDEDAPEGVSVSAAVASLQRADAPGR